MCFRSPVWRYARLRQMYGQSISRGTFCTGGPPAIAPIVAILRARIRRAMVGRILSLPGSPFSLKALSLRRGVVGCNGMFVLLASLLLSLRGCLQTRAALHAENLALRHQLLLL